MTTHLTLDHPFTFKIASAFYWIGVSGVLVGALWLLLLQPGPDSGYAWYLGLIGTLSFLLGVTLTWLHIGSRCRNAHQDACQLTRRRALSENSRPATRMHMLPLNPLADHTLGTSCWCCPKEESPGLWVHREASDLRPLNRTDWSAQPEEYNPNEK